MTTAERIALYEVAQAAIERVLRMALKIDEATAATAAQLYLDDAIHYAAEQLAL